MASSLGGNTKDENGNAITVSRQITNLAAGTNDTDAVNVAQLKAVESEGLNFQGNNTDTTVHINQGGTLQIQGTGTKAATEYSGENILVTGVNETADDGKTVTTKLNIGLDKNIRVDSVTAGQATTDSVQGYAGSVKIVGPSADSTKYEATSLTTAYDTAAKSVNDATINRLQYTDGDGTTKHTVATLEDGLKLKGDAGTGTVSLDSILAVTGGETNASKLSSGNNIGVTASDGALKLQLAKNLTGLNSVKAGNVVMGSQADGSDATKTGNYVTGLDNKTWTVGTTQAVSGRAATEDQLKSVSDVVDTNRTNIDTNTADIAKGLNFTTNTTDANTTTGYKVVNKALGDTVSIKAHDPQSGHTYKTNNLTTSIDDSGNITIAMDTQLTADKVTVGTGSNALTLDGSNGTLTTGSSTLNGTGLSITGGPSLTTSGISGGSKQITSVASGATGVDAASKPVYNKIDNAANIGDVKTIAAQMVTVSPDSIKKNTKVNKTTKTDGTVDYEVALNDILTLGDNNYAVLNGTAGTLSLGTLLFLDGSNGYGTIGSLRLGNYSGTDSYWTLTDNKNGTVAAGTYLTGLTNTSWNTTDPTYVSGRAATEDELAAVSTTVNTGWKAQINGEAAKTVTPSNNTLNFVAGDNIALTQNGDIEIATTPDVNFTTVRVGGTKGTDGTYTGGIYMGSQTGGGANRGTGFYITGLQNTNWDENHIVDDRAATEAQLKKAINHIQTGTLPNDNYVIEGTADDDTTNPGKMKVTLTEHNGDTVSVSGLHDYYVTGGSVSTNTTTAGDGSTSTTATLTLNKNNGDSVSVNLSGLSRMDYRLVENSAAGSDGKYMIDANGDVKLTVASDTDTVGKEITISGLASKQDVDKGLIFTASELADGAISLTHTAQLGDTIGIYGGNKQDGHTYNTNNITTTIDDKGDIRVLMDDNVVVGSKDTGVDGSVMATGQGGAYLKMNGADGSLRMGDASGNFAALIQNYGSDGTAFLKSSENGSPRLQYWAAKSGQKEADAEKTLHTIATLDDGMKFAGDDAKANPSKTVSTTLNSTLKITGGAAADNLTDGNIGVVKNGNDGLTIKLNKDLIDMGTISFAPTETGKQGIKIGSQKVGTSGKGTNNQTGDYITGLTNTKWNADDIVSGRAATEDQLQNVAKSIVNGSATGGGFGLSADNADSTNAKEVKQDLGKTVKITTDGDTNLTTTADSVNKAIVVSLNKDLNLNKATFTDGTSGATTIVDGNGIVVTPKQGSDADKVKLTTDGLSNGGKQITNVQSGLYDTSQNKPVDISTITAGSSMLQNAATIGDLQTVSNGVKTELTNKGLDFKGNGDTTVHRNLGETLTIQGTGADGRDYDGGANVQVKAAKDANTLTVQLDRDLNAHTLTLGKETKGAEKGEEGSLILNGVNKDNGYSPVSIKAAYKTTEQDTDTSLKTNMSRLTYAVANEGTHTVATLEDGLQLSGDNGEAFNTTLDKKVTIKGGVAKEKLVDNTTDSTKNNNIGVVASQDQDGNTTISLQLAKDITGLNTVTAGTVVMGNQTVVNSNQTNETGNYVTGLSNTDWNGTYVSGRAATEDQLKKVSDSIQTSVNTAQFGITAGGLADGGDVTVKKHLGESIRIYGDAPVTNEKNDGSGDFWDRSKANILTKVKKDHNGEDYVSVELQDHLEVGVHGDGKTIEGTDGSMQFKGKSAKEVNITGDTGITLSDGDGQTRTQTAALRQDNGAGYLDLTGTTAGTKATVSVRTGAKNLAQQDQTRLTYTDQDSKAHDVATLDDGLVVAGDNGQVTRLLNSTLKLSGGENDKAKLSSGKNIGVVANKDGQMDIKLAKDLTDIDSVTMTGGLKLNSTNGSSTITGLTNTSINLPDFGKAGRAATEEQLVQMKGSITDAKQGGGFGLTADGDSTKAAKADLGGTIGIHGDSNITTSVSDDGKSINIKLNNQVKLGDEGSISAGGVTINKDGINAGGKNITNVKSGIVHNDATDNTNAANIGDVKKIVEDKVTTVNNDVKSIQNDVDVIKKTGRTYQGDDKKTVKVDFAEGKFLSLTGGAGENEVSTENNIGVLSNGENGLSIRMAKNLKGLESVNTGNSTLNNNGLTINNSEGKAGTTITNSGIKIAANGDNTHDVEIGNSNVSMGGQQIHDVAAGTSATDAVNVGQLSMFANNVGSAINKLDNRVNRVGAGAAALAALHPLDFDPDDKWDFAGGFGHYKNANAAAIGAYYRPNEDTMFSIGGSFGGGENMLNAGVSFKLGQGNHVSTSRTMMAKEIESLKAVVKEQNEKLQENENLRAKVDKQDKEIAELKAMVQQLAARR